jgi:hypothetical protein
MVFLFSDTQVHYFLKKILCRLLSFICELTTGSSIQGGQDSLVDKALDYRPKCTGFDPRLDHKRRSK